MTMIEVNIPL